MISNLDLETRKSKVSYSQIPEDFTDLQLVCVNPNHPAVNTAAGCSTIPTRSIMILPINNVVIRH